MTLTLSTLVDAVPPDRIDEHRATVEDIWQRSFVGDDFAGRICCIPSKERILALFRLPRES